MIHSTKKDVMGGKVMRREIFESKCYRIRVSDGIRLSARRRKHVMIFRTGCSDGKAKRSTYV